MRKTLFIVALLLSGPMVIATQTAHQIVESISGKSIQIIQVALPEAARSNIALEKYKVVVMESGSSYLVVFDDPQRVEGQRGSTARMPSFEVEVRKDDLKIVRSSFVR